MTRSTAIRYGWRAAIEVRNTSQLFALFFDHQTPKTRKPQKETEVAEECVEKSFLCSLLFPVFFSRVSCVSWLEKSAKFETLPTRVLCKAHSALRQFSPKDVRLHVLPAASLCYVRNAASRTIAKQFWGFGCCGADKTLRRSPIRKAPSASRFMNTCRDANRRKSGFWDDAPPFLSKAHVPIVPKPIKARRYLPPPVYCCSK
jgi:hypothetical protein